MRCRTCRYNVGAATPQGGKYRIKILQVDDDGRVHGPCRKCGADVTIAAGAKLVRAMRPPVRLVVKGLTVVNRSE